MNDIMVDLETLGVSPGCVIVSIGATRFNPLGEEVDDPFYANITIQSGLDAGLRIDGATLRWWFEQPDSVRAALFTPPPEQLSLVLHRFRLYVQIGATRTDQAKLWAHGSTFDLPILDTAYRMIGQRIPWSYKLVRDTRTLFSLVPKEATNIGQIGRKHYALDDAVNQARWVQAAYRHLKGSSEHGT